MNPIWILTAAIFAPVTSGLLGLLIPRKNLAARVGTSVAGPAVAMVLLGMYARDFGTHAGMLTATWMPAVQLNLQLNADKLGLFFALLVSSIGLLITLYTRAYFGPDKDSLYRFYPSLLLFMTAMLGLVLADNFMLLLLFWEMTSISSFLLIGWDRHNPSAVKKAMQAFIVTGLGGLAMMGGLILLGVHTGVWSFSELSQAALHNDSLIIGAFLLIFIGAAAKSAQIPFHFWLPGAMAAPTPVSAYLHSATMVKAGVYLIGRLWPIFTVIPGFDAWPTLVIPIGAITMVYGAFIALQKTDLKQIFAYTTVSQLGLLVCMYGLSAFTYDGHPNLIWDVTQILNHALYKAPLFILAGAIGHVASRELPQLKGFFYRGRTPMIMTLILLAAAYALAAGPGTLSFTAKEFFFYQIYHGYEQSHHWLFYGLIAAGIATGMFNVAIFVRLATVLLSRDKTPAPSDDNHDPHNHPSTAGHDDDHHESGLWPAFLWIPGLVLVVFQFIGGLWPALLDRMVLTHIEPNRLYYDHLPSLGDVAAHLLHPQLPLIMSAIAIVLGVGLGLSPILRRVYRDPFDQTYPGFYRLITVGGGRAFGWVQRGHAAGYIALVMASIVGIFVIAISSTGVDLQLLPTESLANLMHSNELLPAVLIAVLVCLTAVLLPIVVDRASRVLVLGACGFCVTAMYYLYRAPDLALTQISIEIVSLVLFLLVLSLIPRETPKPRHWVAGRVALSAAVGVVMCWLTIISSTGQQPPMPYLNYDHRPFANLGEFFLRNSHYGVDIAGLREQPPPNVQDIWSQMKHGRQAQVLHDGGGGDNSVNVILVDFRGFDTMGEIVVLGLAAMGVWTLLRRPTKHDNPSTQDHDPADQHHPQPTDESTTGSWQIDIPEPAGGEMIQPVSAQQPLNRGAQP